SQKSAPTEYVKRQIAVAIIIAVKEPSLLVPVHRVIGRIKIENNLPRRSLVRLQKQVDQKTLDRNRILTNLVIARRLQPAQLQPVEGRFAGHRRAIFPARLELARQTRPHGIMPQLVMVVEVLIAKRNAKPALPAH